MKRLVIGAASAALASIVAVYFRRPLLQLIGSVRGHSPFGLSNLTKDELYRKAQEADIPGRSEMSKDELIRALQQH